MPTISAGSSQTFTAGVKDQLFTLTANGGALGTVTGAATASFGPGAERRAFGPFAVGQAITVTVQAGSVIVEYGDATPEDNGAANSSLNGVQTAAGASGVAGATDSGGMVMSDGSVSWPITSSTFANLPAAASFSGRICRVTDLNNALFESNGTRWKPINGRAVIGSLDTDATMSGTTETIMFQRLLPAGVLRNGDTLSLVMSIGKSGTSETTSVGIRLGTAGTTSDTSLSAFGPLTTTNISAGLWAEYSRISATSIAKLGSGANNSAFAGPSTAALATPVTVSSMDANPLYLTVTMTQSAAVETGTLRRVRLEMTTSAA